MTCIFQVPLLILDVTNVPVEVSEAVCRTARGLWVTLSCASMLAQLLIGIDQHLAVVQSLRYHTRINESRCLLMCLGTWLASVLLGFLAGFDVSLLTKPSDATASIQMFNSCQTVGNSNSYQTPVVILVVVLGFGLPLVSIAVIYCRIFCAAHHNSARTRRNSASSTTMEAVNPPIYYGTKFLEVNSGTLNGGRTGSTASNISNVSKLSNTLKVSMRNKMNHASAMLLYYGQVEEGRAAKLTVAILFMIVLCWSPSHIIMMIETCGIELPFWCRSLAILAGVSSTVITPLLYAYRSKRIQRDIRKGLGFKHKSDTMDDLNNFSKRPQLKRMQSMSCPHLMISAATEPQLNIPNLNSGCETPNTDSPLTIAKRMFSSWSKRRPSEPLRKNAIPCSETMPMFETKVDTLI